MCHMISNALHRLHIFLESIFRVFDILIISLHRHLPILTTLYRNRIYVWFKDFRIFGESVGQR